MRRRWESKCDGDSCCVLPIKEWRVNIDGECPQLHIGISARTTSLCPSCKLQEQRESEGIDYAVPLNCIPIPIATHTLFSAERLLFCGIWDGLRGYELLRCIPFGIWLHVSRGNCIGCISLSSILLPLVFLYLILSHSSVSHVIIDYRSLPVSFRLLLKPSMPERIPILSVVHLK